MEEMGTNNTISIRYADLLGSHPAEGFLDPTFDPLGSRTDYRYNIERFWGPSDHEDADEASIGIPAILLGDFPDVFLGTQQDTPQVADPTQMRRGAVIAAVSAFAIASATAAELPAFVDNAVAKAKTRLAQSELRVRSMLRASGSAQSSYDALQFLHLDYAREAEALQSLSDLVGTNAGRGELAKVLATLREEEQIAEQRLPVSPRDIVASTNAGREVPERDMAIRGPVNFYRPEYGRWWLTDKSGHEGFDSKIPLARRGHYVMYEALNFVNGKRTVSEIRDLVSDEFEPIPVEEFSNYFGFLASVGVVKMKVEVHSR